MLKLLGRTSSINVRKVLWTLREIDVPFEHEDDWGGRRFPGLGMMLRLDDLVIKDLP